MIFIRDDDIDGGVVVVEREEEETSCVTTGCSFFVREFAVDIAIEVESTEFAFFF